MRHLILLILFVGIVPAKSLWQEKEKVYSPSLPAFHQLNYGGGPDSFGYVYESTQDPGDTVTFEWIDPTSGTILLLDDDDVLTCSLPFPFPYYNEDLTTINICSNGFLQWPTISTQFFNEPLPFPEISNLIAAFWDDLDPSDRGTVYQYNDPNNQFVVFAWKDVPRYGTEELETFEIVLYQDGRIKFNYLDVEGNLTSNTIGIQGDNGSSGYFLPYVYNGEPSHHILTDSTSILWYVRRFNHDVGIQKIYSPEPVLLPGEITPKVKVKNYGLNTESFLTIIEFDTLATETLPVGPLAPNDTLLVRFSPQNLLPGIYNFKAFTILSGDENPRNDTLRMRTTVVHYLQDFESSNGNFIPDPSYYAWEWGIPTVGPSRAHSGMNLWGTILNGEYLNDANWKLTSPSYTALIDTPYLYFWHWYSIEFRYDGGNVKLSTDGGNTWQIIYPESPQRYDTIASEYNAGIPYEPCYSGYPYRWKLATFPIPVSRNQNFLLRWHFGTDGSVTYHGWYLDDIAGYGFQLTTGIEEGKVEEAISFPRIQNPTSSFLQFNISLPKTQKLQLKLFSADGRLLKKENFGRFTSGIHKISLNLSQLPNGLYIIIFNTEETEVKRSVVILRN